MNTLNEEKFVIFSNRYKVTPEQYINIEKLKTENMVSVEILKRIGIIYNKDERSFIEPTGQKFTIDAIGNFSPVRSLFFGGTMGEKRVGDALPLDFSIIEKEKY